MKRLVIGVFLLLFCMIAFIGYFTYTQVTVMNRPWGASPDNDFLIMIEEGESARDIANKMVDEGVVNNPNMFVVMADLRGFADKLKAGEYMIHGASTPNEILNMFAIGWNFRHDLVIPEGWTQAQIGQRCEDLGICSKEAFLEECHKRATVFPFVIAQAPDGSNAQLEGVLFPNTYKFIKNTPPERIVNRLVDTYQKVWEELMIPVMENPEQELWWKPGDNPTTKHMHDVVVLASIIEKEVAKEEDRPLVASVFVNRIKKNMRLQSDATVHYFTDKTGPLTKADLETDNPYNTYKVTGLPAGAIGNPGKSALKAAMFPPETDYLFFITMPNGETKFSKTHDEHINLKNEMKAQRAAAQ